MAFLNMLADVLRPRRPMQVTAGSSAAETTYASMSTGAMAGSPSLAAETLASSPQTTATEPEPSTQEKQLMLHLSNISHGVNHFQNQMMAMLWPSIMEALGMSYTQVGALSAINSVLNSICQGAYGFLTPFFSRCKLLGFGNLGIALGTLLSGLAGSYPMLIVARGVASIGSSAQHPVGYSILSSYFPKNRGTVMALNTSVSNVGTLVATPLATAMLLVMGWRHIFFVVSIASVIMGLVYFFFRDYGAPSRAISGKARLAQGFRSYWRVLKNRNMLIIALVFMVGGAGRDGGVNQIYFAPHLKQDFGYDTLTVGLLITAISLGGIVGPIIFGWLSDKFSRKRMLQVSLALSCMGSLWVAHLGPGVMVLFVSLVLYSAFTSSRGTQTQAIIADSTADQDRDAAFSMYFLLGFMSQPIWVLVTGYLMDKTGFATALTVLSVTYIIGIFILSFLKDEPKPALKPAA
ncbi:MAG TPA: MFS transporter [Candidatus Tectomicrobia bacterium]